MIDVDFDQLVIDEQKTVGALIFRLAESINAILVHGRLRDFSLKKEFNKLEFLKREETVL